MLETESEWSLPLPPQNITGVETLLLRVWVWWKARSDFFPPSYTINNLLSRNFSLKYTCYNINLFFLDIKDDGTVVVDFPGHANWKGILSEMELVTIDEIGK